jgi:anti-sigma B factor antagonist
MQKLTVTLAPSARAKTTLITFEGDFDGYAKENITEIQKKVDESKEGENLILDFAKLNFLNSYAIGHLVAWHNHISKLGGQIVIVGLNKNVEEIFSILGINSIFKSFADIKSAEAAL